MDRLPESLLLQILSRLDDSADVARCRVASKSFNTVFPDLRSINLRCSVKRSSGSSYQHVKPFKTIFLDLVSKLRIVESVCIVLENRVPGLIPTDGDFVKEWLQPRVSQSLKSLSLSGQWCHRVLISNVLPLISAHCHNLHTLKLKFAHLSVDNLNPMPSLTSLTLASTILEDEHLNELNNCFPNLQDLNLIDVRVLKDPKIHLLNLKTCHWAVYGYSPPLTLITPNLITLKIKCVYPAAIHVEAPMLSHFHLSISTLKHAGAFTVKNFENLKTLWLDSIDINALLSEFPIIKTLENLTLDSRNEEPRDTRVSKFTLEKMFMVFPNVSSLCINSCALSEINASGGWEISDGKKGLKTICVYLMWVDPLLTFSCVSRLLDQCVGLSEVSLFFPYRFGVTESKSFMSKCMARWPGLKWRWGKWRQNIEDSWLIGISN